MTSKKTNNPFHNKAFSAQKPAVKPEEELQKEDLKLEEELEEEIEEIEKLEEKIDTVQADAKIVCELSDEVKQLKQKLEETHDSLIRAHAEMENIRRHAREDVEKAHKYGNEKFVKELLPVVDSLEKALEIIGKHETMEAVKEGIEMTLSLFLKVLASAGVAPIDPLHKPFDPHLHEAMSAQPSDGVKPNTVIMVYQKGYVLNGRLVRPAMVVVAK